MTKSTKVKRAYRIFWIFMLMYFVSILIEMFIPWFSEADIMLSSIVGQLILFIPVLLLCIPLTGDSPKTLFPFNKVSAMDILLSVLLAAAIEPGMSLLSMLSTIFTPNVASEYLMSTQESPLFYSIVATALIPAVCEEMLFRGAIFSQLKNISLKKACFITGLLFALGHFSVQQLLYALFMGMIMCIAVRKTGSIIPTIIVHFCINGSQVILSRFETYDSTSEITTTLTEVAEATEISITSMILPYLLLTIITIPLIYFILKFMGRKKQKAQPAIEMLALNDTELPLYDETAFDYAPQEGLEEKTVTVSFILILLVYIVVNVLGLLFQFMLTY